MGIFSILSHFHACLVAATQASWRSLEFVSSDPDHVLYLAQPPHVHVFHSLTTLKVTLSRRMDRPVDILPHLQRLENFHAHHLCLPSYPPDVHLPLIQTLHVLHLKSVSIQWLAGQVLPALEECTVISPPNPETFDLVNMPRCSSLNYDSNNLGFLGHFSLPSMTKLKVKCVQWSTLRGTLQVAALHPMFLTAHNMTCLYLQVECSGQLLAHMLRPIPALEVLWLGLARPHALSRVFFREFVVRGPSSSAATGLPNQNIAPLCVKLKRLHLHYERWLRSSEKKRLISDFGRIVASRQSEEHPGFSLCMSSDEGPKGQVWKVHVPVKRFDPNLKEDEIYIGFSSPHGIVPLSTASVVKTLGFIHFKELEFISAPGNWYLPIDDFLPFHKLGEMRMRLAFLTILPNRWLPSNFPLFHTLRVLLVYSIPSSLLAGQIFHKLERYMECANDNAADLSRGLLTEMPVCTRLVVELSRLATLKLPKICELSVCPDDDEPNKIWNMHVAVNANLSGLKLLHLHSGFLYFKWPTRIDLIQILRSLPSLETFISDETYIVIPHVDFFKAFIPTDAQGITRLNQSRGKGQIVGVLCPRLESLQIEDISFTEQPELLPVLKDAVTLRAVVGCPLNSFTIYYGGRKWELAGRDGSFIIEEVVPAKRFVLEI
jgi:hypothetical protein